MDEGGISIFGIIGGVVCIVVGGAMCFLGMQIPGKSIAMYGARLIEGKNSNDKDL